MSARPVGHQRRGEPAVGLADHDQVAAAADRLDHRVCVIVEGGRVVIARQIRGDRIVATPTQLGLHQVPIPADIPGAVDQHERGTSALLASWSRL